MRILKHPNVHSFSHTHRITIASGSEVGDISIGDLVSRVQTHARNKLLGVGEVGVGVVAVCMCVCVCV